MNDTLTERLTSAMKVQGFLTDNAAALAVTPQIAAEKIVLGTIVTKIGTTEGVAAQNYQGDTVDKANKRLAIEIATRKVGAAAAAYFLSIGNEASREALDFNKTDLSDMRDTALFFKANQTWVLADPVKALLVPYQCTAAEVTALNTNNIAFGAIVEKPARNKDLVKKSNKIQGNNFFDLANCLLRIDSYMAPYEFSNYPLWLEYTNNRMQDNTGAHATVLLHLNHAIDPNSVYNINTDAFVMVDTDEITGNNSGSVALIIGFGPNATSINPTKKLIINSGHKSIATALDLGFDGTNTFLNIQNPTGGAGTIDVKITE